MDFVEQKLKQQVEKRSNMPGVAEEELNLVLEYLGFLQNRPIKKSYEKFNCDACVKKLGLPRTFFPEVPEVGHYEIGDRQEIAPFSQEKEKTIAGG